MEVDGDIAKEEFVPLEALSVRATISDMASSVTVAQRYTNKLSHPIEATYLFPLHHNAAVSR